MLKPRKPFHNESSPILRNPVTITVLLIFAITSAAVLSPGFGGSLRIGCKATPASCEVLVDRSSER